MTGLDIESDRVIEVAVVRSEGGRVVGELRSLLAVEHPLSKRATQVTGITSEMLDGKPTFAAIAPAVRALLEGAVFVAHNVPYDLGFLEREFERLGQQFVPDATLDTLLMARRLFAFRRNTLAYLCSELHIGLEGHHRALGDARATHELLWRMMGVIDPEGTVTLKELEALIGALAPNSPLRLQQTKQLRDAYAGRSTLVIEYQNTSEPVKGTIQREIGVWMLKLPYIQAWCFLREGERVFRLDRIRTVLPGGRTYRIPDFEPRI